MLHILPVHSQKRGRLFLPFVDEDPKMTEIMSKIVLLGRIRRYRICRYWDGLNVISCFGNTAKRKECCKSAEKEWI